MGRMIGDPKLQANRRRNAVAGPQVSPKAVGSGTTAQQVGQTRQLVGGQPPRCPWRGTAPQGLGASLVGTLHPLADRPFTNAQRFGNLALGPAFLLETPSLEPSGFFPGRSDMVHAEEYSTEPSQALALNAWVSRPDDLVGHGSTTPQKEYAQLTGCAYSVKLEPALSELLQWTN